MKICVIIPTYNESNAIGGLIREIRKQNFEVVVVDDGSQDNTAQIAQENGAVVLASQRNEGKGASLIKGFFYVLNKDFDAVITMDGDGQHDPADIPRFIRQVQDQDNAIVIGNRMSGVRNMPLIRLFTNRFMSWLISLMAKQNIPDTQCGFRLIKKSTLRKMALSTSNYDTESEILIKAAHLGYKIESVPVKSIYTGEKSGINPITDTLRFIRLIVREYGFRRIKK